MACSTCLLVMSQGDMNFANGFSTYWIWYVFFKGGETGSSFDNTAVFVRNQLQLSSVFTTISVEYWERIRNCTCSPLGKGCKKKKCGNPLCVLRDAFPFEKVWFSGCLAVHGMWSSDLPGSKSSSSSSKKKLKALGEKVQEDLGSNHRGMNSESFQLSKLLVSRWLPRKLTNVLWKLMVGRCISYWNSPFLGDVC